MSRGTRTPAIPLERCLNLRHDSRHLPASEDHMSDSIITDEMRAAIGRESEPQTRELDRTQIRLFARSVGHTDPIYYDVEAAKAAGYRDLPAPPGYLGTPVYMPGKSLQGMAIPEPSTRLTRGLNGGTEFEYYGEIVAGDVLTAVTRLVDFQERTASLGTMLITTMETDFKDASGKLVAKEIGRIIRY
jgi:hypothetical protein